VFSETLGSFQQTSEALEAVLAPGTNFSSEKFPWADSCPVSSVNQPIPDGLKSRFRDDREIIQANPVISFI
jgi:hypothetical protein